MLPDVAIFSILSRKTCLVSLMAIYIRGVGCFLKEEVWTPSSIFVLSPCCVNLGVSLVSPLLCDLGNM